MWKDPRPDKVCGCACQRGQPARSQNRAARDQDAKQFAVVFVLAHTSWPPVVHPSVHLSHPSPRPRSRSCVTQTTLVTSTLTHSDCTSRNDSTDTPRRRTGATKHHQQAGRPSKAENDTSPGFPLGASLQVLVGTTSDILPRDITNQPAYDRILQNRLSTVYRIIALPCPWLAITDTCAMSLCWPCWPLQCL